MKKGILIISLLLPLLTAGAEGAAQPRPFTGSGLLIVRHMNPASSASPPSLILYREPGVGRIGEFPVTGIPILSDIVNLSPREFPLAVMGKRGSWLLIAYDDAGREGWVRMSRWWTFEKWEDFLKGRAVALLPGLRKEMSFLREGLSDSAPRTLEIPADETLSVLEVRDDWILAVTTTGASGWLPWRDDDGRFLVSVDKKIAQQKH
jgi:hypothetical protein